MDAEQIDDPIEFFAALGGLRDTRIESAAVDVGEQVLFVFVDDLYGSLDDSPDYPGERQCALVFLGISQLKFDVDVSDGLRIADIRVSDNTGSPQPYRVEIDLNIGGAPGQKKSISATFASLEIEDVED